VILSFSFIGGLPVRGGLGAHAFSLPAARRDN
jgi:hypothetical protein